MASTINHNQQCIDNLYIKLLDLEYRRLITLRKINKFLGAIARQELPEFKIGDKVTRYSGKFEGVVMTVIHISPKQTISVRFPDRTKHRFNASLLQHYVSLDDLPILYEIELKNIPQTTILKDIA